VGLDADQRRNALIPMAESSDPSDHAVPKDASGWAQVNIFGGWYEYLKFPWTRYLR